MPLNRVIATATLLLVFGAAPPAVAFTVVQPGRNHPRHHDELHSLLSEMDEMCIENAAQYCVDSELAMDCDLEEHEALIHTLQEQRSYHLEHVHRIHVLLLQLGQQTSATSAVNGAVHKGDRIRERHLSEMDEMCVENAAQYCLEQYQQEVVTTTVAAECDLDEIEALIQTLQEQDEYHLGHLETINGLLEKLMGNSLGKVAP